MTHKVSADTSSETITALREEGFEPVFNVEEHQSLDEIMHEINWSDFNTGSSPAPVIEGVSEPVYHLDGPLADDYLLQNAGQSSKSHALSYPLL